MSEPTNAERLTPEPLREIGHNIRFYENAGAQQDVRDLLRHIAALTPDAELGANVRELRTGPRSVSLYQNSERALDHFEYCGLEQSPRQIFRAETLDAAVSAAARACKEVKG